MTNQSGTVTAPTTTMCPRIKRQTPESRSWFGSVSVIQQDPFLNEGGRRWLKLPWLKSRFFASCAPSVDPRTWNRRFEHQERRPTPVRSRSSRVFSIERHRSLAFDRVTEGDRQLPQAIGFGQERRFAGERRMIQQLRVGVAGGEQYL